MSDARKESWVVVGGSVYTKAVHKHTSEYNTWWAQQAVAHNVGSVLAKHIVDLHNRSIEHERDNGNAAGNNNRSSTV